MADKHAYNELAVYYELLDRGERDGAAESRAIEDIIEERQGGKEQVVLDIGCGIGTHLRELESTHTCVGVDVNDGVLQVGANRVAESEFVKGDMRSLPFDANFTVVLCLFHTLAYTDSKDAMVDVLSECYEVMQPGGVMILEIAPYVPGEMDEQTGAHREMQTYEDEQASITSLQVSQVTDRMLEISNHYLVAWAGERRVRHYEDTHELMLYTLDEVTTGLQHAGFENVDFDPERMEMGAFFAEKPPVE